MRARVGRFRRRGGRDKSAIDSTIVKGKYRKTTKARIRRTSTDLQSAYDLKPTTVTEMLRLRGDEVVSSGENSFRGAAESSALREICLSAAPAPESRVERRHEQSLRRHVHIRRPRHDGERRARKTRPGRRCSPAWRQWPWPGPSDRSRPRRQPARPAGRPQRAPPDSRTRLSLPPSELICAVARELALQRRASASAPSPPPAGARSTRAALPAAPTAAARRR